MKKPNIISGPWKVKRYSNSQPYIGSNVGGAICDIIQYRSESNANAQAIVTAVNNTYHKGINPEAVPDMIEALMEVRGYINTKREIFKKEYPEQEPGNINKKLKLIDEALQKAGVNLNAKAE